LNRSVRSYLLAIAFVAGCALFRIETAPTLLENAPFLPFVPAVMAAAYVGDVGPALLSAGLSALAGMLLYSPSGPIGSQLHETSADALLFLVEALVLIVLTHALHARRTSAQRAASCARALVLEREELIAKVGHEWRTPLNTIAGWSQQLIERPDNAALVARAAASISRATNTAARLVEDLLDQSRASRGMMSIVPRRLTIKEPIDQAIDAVWQQATEKGVQVRAQAVDAQARVWGDATRLQQVFTNLLHNAVKFTPAGGRISVTASRVDNIVDVRVSDTGIGIDPAEIPRLFKPFEQVDRRADSRGLGLGLAIARQLVLLHGGSLEGASDGAGRGSTFIVRLPAATSDSADDPGARDLATGHAVVATPEVAAVTPAPPPPA
jgi:signal transduction histidine kinase